MARPRVAPAARGLRRPRRAHTRSPSSWRRRRSRRLGIRAAPRRRAAPRGSADRTSTPRARPRRQEYEATTRRCDVHDNPEPTEREEEQAPDRVPEEDAMSGQGHEDPEQVLEEDDDA